MVLRGPEVEVVGITTVFGNAPITATTANALRVLEVAGRPDISVAQGATFPLARPFSGGASHVHRPDGLGGADLPPPVIVLHPEPAAAFLSETIRAWPGRITPVALGPLTNLAVAVRLDPGIAWEVQEVVITGGATFIGSNVSPVAQANPGLDSLGRADQRAADRGPAAALLRRAGCPHRHRCGRCGHASPDHGAPVSVPSSHSLVRRMIHATPDHRH